MTTELTVFNEFEAGLVLLETSNSDKNFEDTPDGLTERRKWYKKLRKGTNALTKLRKATNEESQRKITACNAEAKTIQARLDVMELPHKTILDAEDAKVQAEIDAKIEAKRLEKEQAAAAKEAELKAKEKELEERAAKLKDAEDAAKAEAERIEHEKELEAARVQAAEDAKQKASQYAIDAAAKAEQDKRDAVAEAKRQAEAEAARKAKEIADKHAEEQAEKERLAGIERERQANETHRQAVRLDAWNGLLKYTPNDSDATKIIEAIIDGKIPNVTISY